MGCEKEILVGSRLRKLSSISIIILILLTSIVGTFPSTIAKDNVDGDSIKTYTEDLTPAIEFGNNSFVIVNVTVDNTTGDPDPPYQIKVQAQNSGEWILVYVSDNDTTPDRPWSNQTPGDGEYWGAFQIGNTNPTSNTTQPPYLHLEDGEYANITENFDGDPHIAYLLIKANYSLPSGPSSNGTIYGFVNYSNGTIAAGAVVWLNQTGEGQVNLECVTNDSGFYIFDDVPPGGYTLRAFIPDTDFSSPVKDINLASGGDLLENLTLYGGGGNGTLCGFVRLEVNGDYQPVSGATVTINRTDGEPFFASVLTNETGFYIFDNNLSVGIYDVTASKEGVLPPWTFNNISVDANEIVWLDFNISTGGPSSNGTIYGFVNYSNGTIAAGAVVWLNQTGEGQVNLECVTNDSGFYIFDDVPPGGYTLRAFIPDTDFSSPVKDINLASGGDLLENLTLYGGGQFPGEEGNIFTVMGKVTDKDTGIPLEGVIISIERHPPPGEGMEFYDEYITDATGDFIFNVSESGPGPHYEIRAHKEGYVGYFKWDFEVKQQNITYINISLTPYFKNNATIYGTITDSVTGEILTDAEIIFVDFNFTHEVEEIEKMYTNNYTINGHENCFNISIAYDSNYLLVLFVDGYYVKFDMISGIKDGEVIWENFSLDPAEPDIINLTIEFFDLDDAKVTVNRTVSAGSPIMRFILDSGGIPESNGNSNGVVDENEVNSYLSMIEERGPSFGGLFDDEQEKKKEEGPSDLLAIPVRILLDNSLLDRYIAGSFKGTLDNLINTSTNSNSTIYYNATFNITLDGPVFSQIQHSLNITLEYSNIVSINLSILLGAFYNFTEIVTNEINSSISHTINKIIITPGSGDSDSFAHANISLSLNTSTVNLPIVEEPKWHIGDKWIFNQIQANETTEVKYIVDGKPLRSWEEDQFRIGGKNASYITYKVMRTIDDTQNPLPVTINDIDWIKLDEQKNIEYLINDVDFPLYVGKNWSTMAWWNATKINAIVVNCSTLKTTQKGILNSVEINYTIGDTIVAQEWYSPDVKFFINRTTYEEGNPSTILDLKDYSFAPYFTSVNILPVDLDDDNLYNFINVTVTINASGLENPEKYQIEGPLFKESLGPKPPTDIEWKHEEKMLSGVTNVTLQYSGVIINMSGVDGPYQGWLELRKAEDWGRPLDYIEFETLLWNHTDFQSPPLKIINYSDYANDTNGNKKADYLTVNITVYTLESGNYSIQGGLNMKKSEWDWRWITGAGTPPLHLEGNKTYIIPVNFPGREIYDAGYDGKYIYHLDVIDEDTRNRIAQIESSTVKTYSHTDFETPAVFFNKAWLKEDGLHDYINKSFFTVNLSIIVENGTFNGGTRIYDLHGGIHLYNESYRWGKFLAGTGGEIILHEGENIVPMNFNAGEIYQRISGINGNISFIIGMGLSERMGDWCGPDIDNGEYLTRNYTINDFPQPDVTIEVTGDYINGSWLTVNVTVSTTESGGGEYDLHGGIHWVEQFEDFENWYHITGTGRQIQIGANESKTFPLNFNGREIYNSKHDGPYKLWIGLDNWTTHNTIVHVECETKEYNYTDFPIPGAYFIRENMTDGQNDFINETDYLTVNVPLHVSQAEMYHINAGIHWIETTKGWEDWRFITGTGEDIQCPSAGDYVVPLNFDATEIRAELESAGYTGVLKVSIGLENETWNQMDHIDYTTKIYSYNDFNAAGIIIANYSDKIVDGNLVVNITLNSTDNGTYRLKGGVHWIYKNPGGWDEWRFITGYEEDIQVAKGENHEEIVFNGRELYNSRQDGPYMIWIGIEKDWKLKAHKEYKTKPYKYSDFSKPEVRIKRENMEDESVDYINGTYLTINVSIEVSTAGTYKIDGGLNYVIPHSGWDEWRWITGADTPPMTLAPGNYTIPLNFNAKEIYNKLQEEGYNGELRAHISVRNITSWMEIDYIEYNTKEYAYNDFPSPGMTFGAMSDGKCDYINGSYLTINVTINLGDEESAGEYDLHGGVHYIDNYGGWWFITGAGRPVELKNGTQTIPLNFNAGEIRTRLPDGYEGNLTVWIGLSSTGEKGKWEEIISKEYKTRVYNKGDFPASGITIDAEDAKDDYINGSKLTVNLTINVSSGYAGSYEIHSGLHWVDKSHGWDEWRFITGTGKWVDLKEGINNITLDFNAGEIYATGKDGPYMIWIGVETTDTHQQLASKEYKTKEYKYTDFPAPGMTITGVEDFKNNSYLTVNVTINVTSEEYTGIYEVHGGVHWVDKSHGWDEWRFITGNGTKVNLTNGTNVIPLNFNGRMIYQSGHNGPYKLWIGVTNVTTWEDITHIESETKYYNYTDFPAPGVKILTNNISDFANDTDGDGKADYLTINVTLNISEPGNYFLEGGLHWMSGYEWRWITWAGREINSSLSGEQTFQLNFNGQDIYAARGDGWNGGKLVAWIAVRNTSSWEEIANVEPPYLTEYDYSPDDFLLPPAQFNKSIDVIDNAINTSGDNKYEWVRVNVTVDVTAEGNYTITGVLVNQLNGNIIASAKNDTILGNGTHQITLLFNGSKINMKHYNGTFEFRAKLFKSDDKFIECDKITSITKSYNYTDFTTGIPPASIVVDSITHYYDPNGNLVINVTIHVNKNHTKYEIYGDLFNNNSTIWITSAANITFLDNQTGNQTIKLIFSGEELENSSISPPYKLAYLRLSAYIDNVWEEIESAANAYDVVGGM